MPLFVVNLFGIVAILAIAVALSKRRRKIRLRVVAPAFALQAVIAFIVLYTGWGMWEILTLPKATLP